MTFCVGVFLTLLQPVTLAIPSLFILLCFVREHSRLLVKMQSAIEEKHKKSSAI